jgi:alpha-N-arabinofuranosidase
VPYLDISGVHDEAGRTLTFFAVNRHGAETLDLDVDLQGFAVARTIDHQLMTSPDLEAVNTLKKPMTVAPKAGSGAKVKDGRLTARLPPYSYQMIRLALA